MNTKKEGRRGLPVLNLESATFTCVWPSCGGACCKDGRPPVTPGEEARIREVIPRVLHLLRPRARAVVERDKWITARRKQGHHALAVAAGYCVFYSEGCALQRLGTPEGDKNKYRPAACVTFPLDRSEHDEWFVRQRGYKGEVWDLDCLDPSASTQPAEESLKEEVAFAERVDGGLEAWRKKLPAS